MANNSYSITSYGGYFEGVSSEIHLCLEKYPKALFALLIVAAAAAAVGCYFCAHILAFNDFSCFLVLQQREKQKNTHLFLLISNIFVVQDENFV